MVENTEFPPKRDSLQCTSNLNILFNKNLKKSGGEEGFLCPMITLKLKR